MKLRNQAILTRNPDGLPAFTENKINGTIEGRNAYVYPNVDWFDYMFKDYSMNQSANLNVRGGTKKVDYFISASINNDNGMLKNDRNNTFDNNIQNLRYSFQSNIGAWLTSSTKVNIRVNSQIVNYNGPSTSTDDLYKYAIEAPNMYFTPTYPNINNEEHTISVIKPEVLISLMEALSIVIPMPSWYKVIHTKMLTLSIQLLR